MDTRAVLINCVDPDVMGCPSEINRWVAGYCKAAPSRLLPCGSIHPLHTRDIGTEIDRILRLGLRLIKLHPPHQLFYPNAYLNGMRELEVLYRTAEENGIPVIYHTGTSVFPGARNKYGDPITSTMSLSISPSSPFCWHTEDGRCGWITALFLVRRHPNVYLDISGIPLQSLLNIFRAWNRLPQKPAWHRLAGPRSSRHPANCQPVSRPVVVGSSQRDHSQPDGADHLAGLRNGVNPDGRLTSLSVVAAVYPALSRPWCRVALHKETIASFGLSPGDRSRKRCTK